MFKDFFKKQINNITAAAALIALSSLVSRFLGIVRDRILASQFGAGTTLDIYYAAFRIPDLIYNLIILGALSAGFIPIFTGLIKDFKASYHQDHPASKNKPAWDLVSNILNILSLALLILSLIGIIFAPILVRLISPGFGAVEQAATASLTRIMFLSPLFLGISGILGGVLQSFKRFLVYSLAPIFYNIGIIVGALYFVDIDGVNGLAWGVVLGAFLHMLIQMPVVYSLGYRYKLKINFKDQAARAIAKMMVPRTLSLAISQINLIVITIIASKLSSGSLTVFNFANNLQSFPIGIFGISFAIAAFPSLAEHAFNRDKLADTFSQAMRQILFFIVPATVLIIALRAQIIRVVLGAGNFDWQDTILTMNTLGFFALSLFAQATIPLLTRVYYARHNSATPLYIGLFTILVNIVLSFYFAETMGVAGLALAYSVANVLNLVLLWLWLYFKVGSLDLLNILIAAGKFIIASLAAGMATQITKVLVWPYVDMTKLSGVFTQLTVAMFFGIIVYILFCYLFKSEELFELLSSLSKRWPFKKVKIEDQGEARGV